ncbi:MAG: GntR family transcriptional regulator [Atopobiaceae bacterium]|nr:GntR family transcriptional regulator [Atopobiaceae bacterium]MBR3235662.1 GntR family transcriptional regulator [Atopobiaceae bacterium]
MLKYQELVNTLLDELANGVYKKGDRLPTTPDLCERYGVSNTTVKRAMDELELQGIVARRRGSGVYIKETTVAKGIITRQGSTSQQMSGMTAEYEGTSQALTSEVHGFSVVRPSVEIADKLGMDSDGFAYYICRTRLVDGTPKVVEYTYMPISLIPNLRESTLRASIYHYIEDELGLKIGSAHRTIKAVMPTEDERTWLCTNEKEPLLEVRQVAYLADGTPFEYSISRHTSDYEFYSISTR